MTEPDALGLTDSDQEPLYWTPARRNRPSAWWGHVPFAFWLIANAKPRTVVELGTYLGVSYTAFCEAVSRARFDTRCFAVDTWKGDSHAGAYGEDIFSDLKSFHDPRYASFSTLLRKRFDEAREDFADASVDFLHIDGLHTYEAVRHDFETWRPKLSERAVVLFHDTNERRDDFGVWRYFGELRAMAPSFEFSHCHGLGVLAVGREPPDCVRRLCALTHRQAIEAAQARFAFFGARWEAEAHVRGLRLRFERETAKLQGRIRELEAQLSALREAPAPSEARPAG